MPTFSFSFRAMLSRHWLVSALRICEIHRRVINSSWSEMKHDSVLCLVTLLHAGAGTLMKYISARALLCTDVNKCVYCWRCVKHVNITNYKNTFTHQRGSVHTHRRLNHVHTHAQFMMQSVKSSPHYRTFFVLFALLISANNMFCLSHALD